MDCLATTMPTLPVAVSAAQQRGQEHLGVQTQTPMPLAAAQVVASEAAEALSATTSLHSVLALAAHLSLAKEAPVPLVASGPTMHLVLQALGPL